MRDNDSDFVIAAFLATMALSFLLGYYVTDLLFFK